MAQASSPVTVQRREKEGTRRNVECPPLLPDYQSFMRGIDRGDQLMGYYNVGRRSFMRGIDRGDQLMGYYNVGRRSFMRGIDRGDQLMGYYNVGRRSFMRGIDRGDQLMGYYNVSRSKKWWKRVFAYLLEVFVLNVYILQKSVTRVGRNRTI